MNLFPIQVMDRLPDGEIISRDICSRLLEDRIVFLYGEIEADLGYSVIAQLLYLAGVSEDPINIYINSEGGHIIDALALYDTIKFVKPIIKTTCIGQACSASALLLAAGTKGYRSALPNSRVMIHELRGGVSGTRNEMVSYSNESDRVMDLFINILSDLTGKKFSEIAKDMKKDFFMNPEEALKYGLIDNIVKEGK